MRINRSALEEKSRNSVGQGSVNDVGVASDPANVGHTAKEIARMAIEHQLVGQRGVQQVTGLRVHHTFGLACAAGSVEHEERIFTVHGHWIAFPTRRLHGLSMNIPRQDLI